MRIASASSSNGIRQATGPKISSCAICMRLSTSAKTVGSHEVALAQRGRQVRRVEAADQQLGAFLRPELDVAAHLGQVLGLIIGPTMVRLVQRVADRDARRARGEVARRNAS